MTLPSDPDLVRRCRAGDEAAWEALTLRYADVVYGVARRSGLDATDAGDVVQEVFLALFKSLGRLQRSERLLAWILKTARREAWRQVRRARSAAQRERAASRGEAADQPLPAEVMTALEREQDVREAFQTLSERCRRLLDALFFTKAPESYADVSARLGVPVGSIGPTRSRCLAALRKALEARGFGPPDVSGGGVTASRGSRRRRP